MKKILLGFGVVVTMVVAAFISLENGKKNNSYSTPEAALNNVENPKYEVLEIIDTKVFDSIAYVFYYSEVGLNQKNYLAVAKIDQNKYGWRFHELLGIGDINESNVGNSSGKDNYIVGFAPKEVDKLKFGSVEAELIAMETKGMKAFLLHGVESELMGQADFQYFDIEGHELTY
ncbi:hypothetical protein [Bacillus suaedae]|uniref:Uncharacterized protein n=1 Tax=Halalkalibacter suaedae TaxID=2822140 RepID=A0A940WWF1_9BACI|nr:hypothetical protein [Bacillus suaedae]MBP3951842.1 hypothetical protein [Bacillus suaedae]